MKLNRILMTSVFGLILLLGAGYQTAHQGLQKSEPTKKFLEAQGYSEVIVTGWDWVSADQIWRPSTGFIAKTPSGIRCTGAVVVDSDGQTRIRFN